MQPTSMFALHVAAVLCVTSLSVSAQGDGKTHPWASFPVGSWVEVHADRQMTKARSTEPQAWASDSRVSVGAIAGDAVTIKHENAARKVSEQASVAIPAVDALPGVRALGQWPGDVFPFFPERESGVTPAQEQPTPKGVKTEAVREEKVEFGGATKTAKVIKREWQTVAGKATQSHVLTAWVVEGIELPIKWTLEVDGKARSQSELVSLEETVKVGDLPIPCIVTRTRRSTSEGFSVERRWSSSQVPGFMVKMESRMKSAAYSLTVKEWVTGFQVAEEAEDEGNPPGARPALGFMPGYDSEEEGVSVEMVTPGGPADQAGMKEGDLIVGIGGEDVFGIEDYMDIMSTLRIGKKVSVKVKRDGKKKELTVVVGERGGR